MAVDCQVVRFQKDTSGTNGATQDVSLTFTPKAIKVISTGQTAEDTAEANYHLMTGFSDGTNHAVVHLKSTDNQAAPSTQRIHRDDAVIVQFNATAGSGTIIQQATCAFATNKVTFTWTVNDVNATDYVLIAFGGSDITNAKVNTVSVGRTTTGIQDFTGLGFNPIDTESVIFVMGGGISTTNAASASFMYNYGAAVTTAKRFSHAVVTEPASDPTDTWKIRSTSHLLYDLLPATGAVNYHADFAGWITDGFQLNFTDGPDVNTRKFSYLVIKGGKWDLGTLSSPTTTSNNQDYAVSVNSNTLRGIVMSSVAVSTSGTLTANNMISHGFADASANQGCIAVIDEDAQATTDNYRLSNGTNLIKTLNANAAANDVATFDSFTANNFRLDWVGSGSAENYDWVVVADFPIVASTLLTKQVSVLSNAATGFQNVTFTPNSGDPNWIPKVAIIEWNRAINATSTWLEHASYGFGFTDGTSQRCVAFTTEDNQTASDTASIQRNNALVCPLNPTGTVETVDAVATFSSWIPNGIRLNWTDAPAAQFYLTITFLGGDDLTNATVGTLSTGTGTGDVSDTSLSYQPDFGFFLTGASTTENSPVTTGFLSLGAATSSSAQWVQSIYSADNSATMSTRQTYYHNNVVVENATSTTGLASLSSFNANGFTINVSNGFTASYPIYYLVLKGGSYVVGNNTEPGSTGNQTVTTNKDTKAVGIFGLDTGTAGSPQAGCMWSSGFCDNLINQFGHVWEDTDGSADSVVVSALDGVGHIYNNITANATVGSTVWDDSALINSVSSSGFVINWDNVGNARPYRYVTFGIPATSTLFERGITEASISVSDSNTRTLTANRALSESSISVSDSNTRLLTAMRPIAEPSISVNDSNTRLRTAFAPISEASITVSDDLARTKIVPRSINESTITVGDSLARLLTAFRTISEPSITVSETVSGNLFVETFIDEDPITVGDSLVRLLIATRSLSESSISVSDDLARVKTIIRLIDEGTITVSDSLARTIIRVRSITEDAISVSDSLARLLIAVRTIGEDVDVSDALARILIASRTISESSITVSDALARTVVFPRSISEPSISVSDSLTRLLLANRAISESSISVSDALARVLIIVRAIAEDVDVSDSLARLLIATRTLADTITVSDLLAGQLIFLREIDEDPITVGDSVDTDETKLALIFEPAITVSDSLVRRLSAFRTISETVTVSDLLVGAKPVPVLAEYITDEGYTNPIRFRVTFKSRKSDTLADESGDQIIYYQYDSFVPEARPFNITDFSLKLTQGEISAASLTIEDHKELIGDPRKIGFKSVVEVDFKKELGRSWERILTGFVRRVRTLRPANKALSYGVTILSKQIIDSERIINFKRAAKRGSVDSVEALTTDSNMAANKLFKEIYNSINHFPRKNSPAVKDTGEYDLDTGSISDEVIDFITEIAPGLTTVAETTNQLTEGIGAIKGVDEFGNPYLRYPTEKHSGIVITDNPQDLDSALNTSVNMASFEFEDSIDIAEGFANRLYVLNSKEAKSTASSSKASGFTTLTTRWIAQSFTADDNNVTSAAFILSKTGNPTNTAGTIKGLLRASSSNGNFPTGSTLATFEISFSQLTNAKDTIFVNDIKTKDGAIVIGQKYWWVLQGTGLFDDTHTVNWHHDNDLATTGRPRSAKLPLVDTDPTKPGNQFNWISSPVAEVYAFSTFSSVNHILTQSDPESIKENGLIEAVVSLPAFNDDATYQKVLVKIIKDSAKIKRIFNYTRVTIPTAKLFKPGELVTVVDSKAKLDIEKVINAEIVEVTYNFDTNSNALGCKYVDLRLVGFIDNVTNDYLENKEC